jgi:hypothetical protein
MRRISSMFVLATVMTASTSFAEDAPPPAATTTEAAPAQSSGSKWRQPGALFDGSEQTRSSMLSVFVGLPYGYWAWGFPVGVGARYYLPLLHNGFISSMNDEFGLEFGVDGAFIFSPYGAVLGIDVPVEAMWAFHLSPNFAAYAKAGLGIGITSWPIGYYGQSGVSFRFVGVGGVGIMYKLTEALTFRAEVGTPWAKVGLGFSF